jgi:hypothetical protein
MTKNRLRTGGLLVLLSPLFFVTPAMAQTANLIGKEISIPTHLQDGQEFQLEIKQLISFGQQLFQARWTSQEGQGRPLSKGTGAPLLDPTAPLVFPRNFDRLSGPDSNSCAGCHNTPFLGAGGDRVSAIRRLQNSAPLLLGPFALGSSCGVPDVHFGRFYGIGAEFTKLASRESWARW